VPMVIQQMGDGEQCQNWRPNGEVSSEQVEARCAARAYLRRRIGIKLFNGTGRWESASHASLIVG
jgi:hypothetical protein